MKIFLITPIYATTTQGSGATPVVHYFAKEWAKQGHEVHVFNLQARFPRLYYWIGKHFQHYLNTKLGMLVPTECPKESHEFVDGVDIHNICLKKIKPHSEITASVLEYAIDQISQGCEDYGVPDVFIGHWHNPQLLVLRALKQKYSKKTVLVLHSNSFELDKYYGDKKLNKLITNIDVLGFRNKSALVEFKSIDKWNKKTFIAYSGVSSNFIEAGYNFSPNFEYPITDYIYVGSLIERKYPSVIVKALNNSNLHISSHISYIGDGAEKTNIETECEKTRNKVQVRFTGRIPRDSIIEELKKAQVFVMISKNEVFGLVYLEAMALGLIPVGSRNEGIDGIIVDGENGFLCEPGNEKELTEILIKIQSMSSDDLKLMSDRAKATALSFSDSKVAVKYIKDI